MKNRENLTKGEKHYGITEVFHAIGKENLELESPPYDKNSYDIQFDGYLVHPHSLRYMTFYQKGTDCVCCGRKGAYFTLDRENRFYKGQRRHFNLWSEDGIMITKDHIVPKKYGGTDHISNMQTMCSKCNAKKGSRMPQKLAGGEAYAGKEDACQKTE